MDTTLCRRRKTLPRYGTRLFQWAELQHLDLAALSCQLGYSERHLIRIRDAEYPVNEAFVAKVVHRLGDWARSLFFLLPVSEESDSPAYGADMALEAASSPQDAREGGK